MKRELKHDKLFNVRMSEELIKEYKQYCEDNGFLMSKRIRFILEKDIQSKLEIKK
jgi:predicted DNA binding CopG/RHH family protein